MPCTILQRDQDTEYVQAFDDVFTGEGRTIKKTPIKSPNLQAFVERVIQTLKHEVLNAPRTDASTMPCSRAFFAALPAVVE